MKLLKQIQHISGASSAHLCVASFNKNRQLYFSKYVWIDLCKFLKNKVIQEESSLDYLSNWLAELTQRISRNMEQSLFSNCLDWVARLWLNNWLLWDRRIVGSEPTQRFACCAGSSMVHQGSPKFCGFAKLWQKAGSNFNYNFRIHNGGILWIRNSSIQKSHKNMKGWVMLVLAMSQLLPVFFFEGLPKKCL